MKGRKKLVNTLCADWSMMEELQSKQNKVQDLREKLKEQEQVLQTMYDETAQSICPFNVGQEIEYEPGKKGIVQKIFFPRECWQSLEEQEPIYWSVTGKKTNKNGKFGKKDYQPVSNKTHIINSSACRRMTLEEKLAIK